MIEEWKVVKGFENYEVSNCGRVRNIKTGKLLSTKKDIKDRYIKVKLYRDKKYYTKYVHSLVAEHFVEKPDNVDKPLDVNHIDKDKKNNNYRNLEYLTRQQNVAHYYNNLSYIDMYTLSGEFIERFDNVYQIIDKYNKNWSRVNIQLNLGGHTKSAYGYIFKYSKNYAYADD